MKKNIKVLFLAACVLLSTAVFATEFKVNTYTTGRQYNSVVASDGTNYLITWESEGQDGSSYGVYGQIVNSSGNLVGSEFKINTYTTNNQQAPAMSSNGANYLVTWESPGQDGSGYGVYGQIVDSSGQLVGDEFKVNTYNTYNQAQSSVVSDGTNYMVTWESSDQDGSSYGVYGQIVNSSGNLVGSEFKINTYTMYNQEKPAIASTGNNYLVTWQSYGQDGNEWGLYGQVVNSSGQLVNSEFQINTCTTQSQWAPAVASDGTNYMVTWTSIYQDGSEYGVYGQFIDQSGVLIGDEFQINTYTIDKQNSSAIAFDGINYLVIWESFLQDSSEYGVYGQLIDQSGVLIGDEFLINSYLVGNQYLSSIASDGTDYLATWTSESQDGTYSSVYGDIIAGTPKPATVPEPATMLLLVSTGLGLLIRRKK